MKTIMGATYPRCAGLDVRKQALVAFLKLGVVLTDIMGKRGRAVLQAIIDGHELGIDMSRFKTRAHPLSWACPWPRNDESAGKRRSTRLRRGAQWLMTTLVQASWLAVCVDGS
jgi:transposase IS116/IS110/IS902 family protein